MSKVLLFWRKHNEENRAMAIFKLIDRNWRLIAVNCNGK